MVEYKKAEILVSKFGSIFISVSILILSGFFISSSYYVHSNMNNIGRALNRMSLLYSRALNETRLAGADLLIILEELDLIFTRLQKAYPHFEGSYRLFKELFKNLMMDSEFVSVVEKYKEIRSEMRFPGPGDRLGGNSDHSRLLDEIG